MKHEPSIQHNKTHSPNHENKTITIPTTKRENGAEENQEKKVLGATQSFSYIALLNTLKTTKPALVADLKNARFEKSETKLTLIFPKKWNYDRVNTPIIKNTIIETLEVTFGEHWQIDCRLDESTPSSLVDGIF
jgi:hypothetical protein